MKFKYRFDGPAAQRSEMKPRMLPAELSNLLHWFDSYPDQTFPFGTGSGLQGLGPVAAVPVSVWDRRLQWNPRFQGHPGTPTPRDPPLGAPRYPHTQVSGAPIDPQSGGLGLKLSTPTA